MKDYEYKVKILNHIKITATIIVADLLLMNAATNDLRCHQSRRPRSYYGLLAWAMC